MPSGESKRITLEEMKRRQKALERADAHNRIEGIMPNPETDPIFEGFVRGEIELEEMQLLIQAALRNG